MVSGMRNGEQRTISESRDCALLSPDESRLLEDLVKKGLHDVIDAIKRTSSLADSREPDVALSIGLSAMLSVMMKAQRDLTSPDGSNYALDACAETFNDGCARRELPYKLVRV